MNLPNKITITRICLIPLLVVLFYLDVLPYHYPIAAVVFIVAACTDFIDGHVARKYGLVTNLGKFLDPIADKVLVSTALILLLTRPAAFEVAPFGQWGVLVGGVCTAIILARELIISGFRMIAAGQNLVLAADKLGKAKTIMQDIAIGTLLGAMGFLFFDVKGVQIAGQVFIYIGLACFVVCTVLTVLSGVNYIVRNKQVLKDKKPEEGGKA